MSANPKLAAAGPLPGGPQPPPHPAFMAATAGPLPPGVVPVPGANPSATPAQPHVPMQPQIDPETKRMHDLIDAINLVATIREDINTILDHVGKTNPWLSTAFSQIQQQASEATTEPVSTEPSLAPIQNADIKVMEFLEKTESKHLVEKVVDINKCLSELEKIVVKEPQQVQLFHYPVPDFNAILLDQADDKVSSQKLITNYRWFLKLQECISYTSLMPYKRFSQTYAERKSTKFKTYSIKPLKREEVEKVAHQIILANSPEAFKILTSQKSENQFVLDIIMPQNFKFVFLLFDLSVEKLQVRPIDNRMLKVYQSSKQRTEDICYFDFEHKNTSNVFQRLEQNCLLACAHFKTEHGVNHFKYLLNWLKNFVNLFNAKCSKCEKHLLNGLPPTWRDLKTLDPLHDECKIY